MKGENISEKEQEVAKKFEIAVQLVKSLPQSASFSPSYAEATKAGDFPLHIDYLLPVHVTFIVLIDKHFKFMWVDKWFTEVRYKHYIYSYFKQSKFGPCTIPRPGFWDVVNRAKWDAWSALGAMSTQDAMQKYVEEIKKVYFRIKDIDAFEERHVEFADVLIPFCQATGTPLTSTLMEIVKEKKQDENHVQVNGSNGINGTHELENEADDSLAQSNGLVADTNLVVTDNSTDHTHSNGDMTEKVSKTVKFQITGDASNNNSNEGVIRGENGCHISLEENVNGDIVVHKKSASSMSDDSLLVEKQSDIYEKEEGELTPSEKEDGELSLSENDSDEEEIYCDSLDPDQINVAASNDSFKSPPVIKEEIEPLCTVETGNDVLAEPVLFSPIQSTTTFQDTTAQNILKKPSPDDQSCSSSNNSRSEYEVVDMTESMQNAAAFQSVRKRDIPVAAGQLNMAVGTAGPAVVKLDKHSGFVPVVVPSDKSFEMICLSCTRNHHHKKGRQGHSGHRSDGSSNGGKGSRNSDNGGGRSNNNNNNQITSYHQTQQHQHRHSNRRSTSEGSNGASDDDSSSSLSSSSSDNVGLKIIKALERMDDNMQLILNRLDSIDNSMKILAVQPPPPWWVQYIPSKWVILSTLWPFIVNLIFFYLWRRKRRRNRHKIKSVTWHPFE